MTTDWDLIVKEILNKASPNATFNFIPRPENKTHCNSGSNTSVKCLPKQKKKYSYCPLGPKFPNVYFTQQETKCMKHALQGKTMREIAKILKLSSRTVEYYMQSMRHKTDVCTKSELIEKVLSSDFMKNMQLQNEKSPI